jgi:hypothetical protein
MTDTVKKWLIADHRINHMGQRVAS